MVHKQSWVNLVNLWLLKNIQNANINVLVHKKRLRLRGKKKAKCNSNSFYNGERKSYRAKNPWFLFRRMVLGWNVRFGNKSIGSDESSAEEQSTSQLKKF